jgi:acetolactate decarboxylase
MKNLLFIIIGTFVSLSTDPATDPNFIVEYKGALKNMMHKGDISAKADLLELKETEHLYALGALENLKGEIQIFDSKSFNTSVIDSSLSFDNSFDKKATLIVYASVDKWKSISIPDNIVSYEQLEDYIKKSAERNHININKPFPFLIEGKAKSFDWHVINWKDGDTEHSHEKHISSGLHGSMENTAVEMLGFYSNSHHAIFTHHTTNLHIHVKTVDNKIAGHLDGLVLEKGMILKLPADK